MSDYETTVVVDISVRARNVCMFAWARRRRAGRRRRKAAARAPGHGPPASVAVGQVAPPTAPPPTSPTTPRRPPPPPPPAPPPQPPDTAQFPCRQPPPRSGPAAKSPGQGRPNAGCWPCGTWGGPPGPPCPAWLPEHCAGWSPAAPRPRPQRSKPPRRPRNRCTESSRSTGALARVRSPRPGLRHAQVYADV